MKDGDTLFGYPIKIQPLGIDATGMKFGPLEDRNLNIDIRTDSDRLRAFRNGVEEYLTPEDELSIRSSVDRILGEIDNAQKDRLE